MRQTAPPTFRKLRVRSDVTVEKGINVDTLTPQDEAICGVGWNGVGLWKPLQEGFLEEGKEGAGTGRAAAARWGLEERFGQVGKARTEGRFPSAPTLSPVQSQAAGEADALFSAHPPFTPTRIHIFLPSPRARPRALGFPQSHSCLDSSCHRDSQAGAGSHAVCGHTLHLGLAV